MLRCISVIGDELLRMDLFTNWVSSRFDGKDIRQFRPDVFVASGELRKGSKHIEHGYSFAHFEKDGYFRADIVDKALNRLITHVDDLIMRVHNLLVQLDEVKGLAFYAIFPAVYVDEDS